MARLLVIGNANADEVVWSLFGLSMAGWNMAISGLAGLAGIGLLLKR
jgi:disulfide bond formation protein DsbB